MFEHQYKPETEQKTNAACCVEIQQRAAFLIFWRNKEIQKSEGFVKF